MKFPKYYKSQEGKYGSIDKMEKTADKEYNFEDKEVVFHAMSKGGKDWFKITYDKKYNTFDKKSPTSMGGGYSESELGRIVKNELEYTPVVLIDKLKLTSDTVKDEDYKNNYFNEKSENRSYSDKEQLNEAFKNNSPADANILAKYHDLLKDIIRLFNSGVVSASRYFGEKGIIDLSKKVGSAKTFKAARELFLKFTKDATETMKDYLLLADAPAIRLIGEPLYNELKEKYVGNFNTKPEDTMAKQPTTNLMLYTKIAGDKTYKATDLKGNQVSNLAYASLISPNRYIDFIEAVRKTANENPNTYFRVIETGNKKVWYDSESENLKKEDRWQTIYGNNPDFAAVYSIGNSKKEVVVIKHKGKNYVIYADIAGVRREKDITHVGEAMEWLKGVLTKMSDVIGDKEVDESVIKARLKFQYGKDLLEVNKTEMAKEKKYDLGFGSLGSGTTVYNRAKMVSGDYPKVAHISEEGVVNYYGKEYPAEVKKEIEDFAKKNVVKVEYDYNNPFELKDITIKRAEELAHRKILMFSWNGNFYKWVASKDHVGVGVHIWKYPTEKDLMAPSSQTGIKEEIIYNTYNSDQQTPEGIYVEHSISQMDKKDFFKAEKAVEKSVDATDAEVYIEYLNKDDRFKPMKKYFTSYSDAVKWGKEQFEKFDVDMVCYIDKSSSEPAPKAKAEPSTKDFEGSQESGTGKLYEYFTPMDVVEKMWALAYHYGKDVFPLYGMKVLDPAMGSGRLFTYAPKSAKVTGFEINKSNEEVAMKYCVSRGFSRIQLYNESFEVAFLNPPRYNSKLKGKKTTWLDEYPFDLVVANPPYGKFTGLYKTHFNFNGQFEHFFIEYSMKLVKQNGLGVFVVPSSFLRNGNTYNSVKERIFAECKLVDAYRLPANIFKHTQIGTDIIVLQKK